MGSGRKSYLLVPMMSKRHLNENIYRYVAIKKEFPLSYVVSSNGGRELNDHLYS